jgi:DNA-directed RNA polymerase specialized sigma24 family protein
MYNDQVYKYPMLEKPIPEGVVAALKAEMEEGKPAVPELAKENTARARALTRIMKEDRGFLLGYFRKYLDRFKRGRNSEADYEDVLQELFFRLNGYTNLVELQSRLDNEAERRQWLAQEANKVIKSFRRSKIFSIVTVNESPEWRQSGFTQIASDPLLANRLIEAVGPLGDIAQTILPFIAAGNNETEIASILNLPVEQVADTIFRMRSAIKENIGEADLEVSLNSPLDIAVKERLKKQGIEEPLSDEVLHRLVVGVSLNLPAFYQKLLHLFYFQKQTSADIAATIGSHQGTVTNNLRKIFIQLTNEVAKQIKLKENKY